MKKYGKLERQKRSIERTEATIVEYEKTIASNTEGLKLARKEKDQTNINTLSGIIEIHEKKIVAHKTTLENTKRNMK